MAAALGCISSILPRWAETCYGLEYDFERAAEAAASARLRIINAAGEFLPLPAETFDLILSHEVIEHVQDDRAAVQ